MKFKDNGTEVEFELAKGTVLMMGNRKVVINDAVTVSSAAAPKEGVIDDIKFSGNYPVNAASIEPKAVVKNEQKVTKKHNGNTRSGK